MLDRVNRVYAAVLTGNLIMFICGSSLTWSSPEILKLSNITSTPFEDEVTPEQLSWISSLVTLGAAVGPLFFGYLADRIGRKPTILSLGIPFFASYLIMAYATTVNYFYLARLLAGLGVGGCFATMPLYISELALKSQRGTLAATLSTAVCLGFLFSYALGPYVSVFFFNFVLAMFPALFLVLFLAVGVECPHFYVRNNHDDLAKRSLEKIRQGSSEDAIAKELLDIQGKVRGIDHGTLFYLIKSKAAIKALIIATGLLFFQQFTGINAVLFYSQTIFQKTEADLSPDICSIIIGVVQFVSSLVTPFIADKFGRKTILIVSAIAMVLCELPLGIFCYLKDQGKNVDSVSFIPILTLTLFILSYNFGFGPVPWIILGEIFPIKIKTVATSFTTFINWMTAFIITKYFDSMIENLGIGQSFLIFAGFCVLAGLFTKFVVVETKGNSLEEIQDILNHPV